MKQNRTRTALADAYMRLLNDYTIDRITVKMITDAVGCSRKTFYYYFTDVYVLTQYVFELRVQQFLDTNGNFETMREGFLTLAANLSNDRQAILNIYHGYGKEELERFTWETSDYYARQVITRYAQNMDIAPEDLEAIIRMYTDMMFGMLIDWINNGMEGDYSRKLDIALTALMPCFLDWIHNHHSSCLKFFAGVSPQPGSQAGDCCFDSFRCAPTGKGHGANHKINLCGSPAAADRIAQKMAFVTALDSGQTVTNSPF